MGQKWTDEIIKRGIERFYSENGRYPSAKDFDYSDYLPSGKQIQRQFGGFPNMRKILAPQSPEFFTKGAERSEIARLMKINSYVYEENFYNFLVSKNSEIHVHEQKRLRPGNIACDFYIYVTQSHGFAIDIFFAKDRFNLYGVINIKFKRYKNLSILIIFIVIGDFTQSDIEQVIVSKRNPLNRNMYLYTEKYFQSNYVCIVDTIKKVIQEGSESPTFL